MNSCLPETSWHYRNLRYEVTCWERGEFKWVILPRKHFDLSTAKFQSRRSVNIFTAIYLIAAYQQGLFPILWQLFAVFETTCFVVGRSALLCLWETLFSYSVLLVTCFTVCLASLTRCHLGTVLDSVWPSVLKRHLPVGCLNVSVAAHGYTIWKMLAGSITLPWNHVSLALICTWTVLYFELRLWIQVRKQQRIFNVQSLTRGQLAISRMTSVKHLVANSFINEKPLGYYSKLDSDARSTEKKKENKTDQTGSSTVDKNRFTRSPDPEYF